MIPTDLLADLPPPEDSEPASLRNDIADELLDHLQCAYRREVLKDGDDGAAQRRVLDRFGDPRQLARRLWWQAMWSRVMGKRILAGLQWVLTAAAVTMAGAVCWQQSQILSEMNETRTADAHWRGALQMTLQDLRNRLPAPVAAAVSGDAFAGRAGFRIADDDNDEDGFRGGMPGARIDDDDDRAAAGMGLGAGTAFGHQASSGLILAEPTLGTVSGKLTTPRTLAVQLTEKIGHVEQLLTSAIKGITLKGGNRIYNALSQMPPAGGGMRRGGMEHSQSGNGAFIFTGLEPDRYELKITLADGQHCTKQVLIRDDKPQELTVVCPGPRKKMPVLMTMQPLPEDLRKADESLAMIITYKPQVLNGVEWYQSNLPTMTQVEFDLQTGLTQGSREIRGDLEKTPVTQTTDLRQTPEEERDIFLFTGPMEMSFYLFGAQITKAHTLQSAENSWELELPEELIAEARKRLAGDDTNLASGEPPGAEPGAVQNPPEAKTSNDLQP